MQSRRKVQCARRPDHRFGAGAIVLAVLISWGSYVLGASLPTPATGRPIGGQVGLSKAKGIDSCTLPGVPSLKSIWEENPSKFAYIGTYIGGITQKEIGCNKPSKTQVNELHAIGYDFLLLMDGRQPPCTAESKNTFSEDPAPEGTFLKAREQAANEVNVAIRRMEEHGFTNPGSIVYYDLETFNQNSEHPNCLAATKAFTNNWDRRLKEGYEVSSGLYGPAEGAHVDEFWNLSYNPDDLWYSEIQEKHNRKLNEEHESVWDVPISRIPDNHWPERRLHQWEKDAPYESLEGLPYVLDFTCAQGLVAGSGGKRDEPKCQAK